ncbi:MAG: ECF transporter S component, partial [Firmicutes bacterium]|nr:ECF transporter S component [Bacillota bacterium]
MQGYLGTRFSGMSLRATSGALPNICLYGLLYAGLTLLAYLIPTGDFLLRPGAALLLVVGASLGPVVGFGAGFLGGFIADLAQNMLWIHWDIGLGIMGAIFGLFKYWRKDSEEGAFSFVDSAKLIFLAFAGSFIGMYFAGLVDLLLGAPALIAFYAWALPAALVNSVFAA